MKLTSRLPIVFAMLLTISMAIAACAAPPATAPAPTAVTAPTKAAAPTTAPAPTAAAAATTAPAAAAFKGMKVEAPDCKYGGEVKSLEAIDQLTFKMTLCKPDAAIAHKVAPVVMSIQDQDFLNANGGNSLKMSEKPDGTGPYMLKEWVRGDHITFEADPNYWGPAPKSKTLVLRWSKEAAQRLLELKSGTVDGIDNPNPEDYDSIKQSADLKLLNRSGQPNTFYIGLNNLKPPLDNEKVRQAIAMSIDKERLLKNFYPAGSLVAEQFVPPSFKPGYSTEGDGAKWYKPDPAAAKALLAEAGFPDGIDLTLGYRDVVRSYLPLPGKVAQDLQAQLAPAGIRLKIAPLDSTAFLQSVSSGQQQIFLLGWGADYPDPTNFYDFHLTGAIQNFGKTYPDLVEAINAAALENDPVERQKKYDTVNALVKKHVPLIPMMHGTSAAVFKGATDGAYVALVGGEKFRYMGNNNKGPFVWMQGAEPSALWCADTLDGESQRACGQLAESLVAYKPGTLELGPNLAEKWEANKDLTEWTFTLRPGVKFHSGATLDANDVVATFAAQWDAKNPNHKGQTGGFEYWAGVFGPFLNGK
jgi:ABC-type transport system substrate-binding protein